MRTRRPAPPIVGMTALAAALGIGCAPAGSTRSTRFGAPATAPFSATSEATTTGAWTALDYANRQIGKGYCWGGTGPACFDCSGLVGRAWAAAGVRLPRSSEAIASSLPEVPLDDLRPGDVLWWPGHVALYAGDGWEIEALDARDGVVWRRWAHPRKALRPGG